MCSKSCICLEQDIGTHLGSGLNSVAENLEGAFIQIGEGTAERAGNR